VARKAASPDKFTVDAQDIDLLTQCFILRHEPIFKYLDFLEGLLERYIRLLTIHRVGNNIPE
jgi:hypothetical protein